MSTYPGGNSTGQGNFIAEVGKQTFLSPQIRKFLGSLCSRKFANCASPLASNPQIFTSNLQIAAKHCTILSQNSPKSRICKRYFLQIWIWAFYAKFGRTKVCICWLVEFLCPQITYTKIGPANRKTVKCHICGRSANLTSCLSVHICWFAICGAYLRTTFLCHIDGFSWTLV